MDAPAPETRESGTGSPGARCILAFTLETQEFGLPLDAIVEIIAHGHVTPVPHPEPAIEGILPLRGRMVTLLNLRRLLDRPEREAGSSAQIIVTETSGDLLGLVVDTVTRVMTTSAIPEPLERVAGLDGAGPFEGTVRSGDGRMILLDLPAILRGLA